MIRKPVSLITLRAICILSLLLACYTCFVLLNYFFFSTIKKEVLKNAYGIILLIFLLTGPIVISLKYNWIHIHSIRVSQRKINSIRATLQILIGLPYLFLVYLLLYENSRIEPLLFWPILLYQVIILFIIRCCKNEA